MNEKFQNKYRLSSARLQNWDYGWNAAYFVTICTQNRAHYFGDIVVDTPNFGASTLQLSEIGTMAEKYWLEIPEHFPFVQLGAFVVMPNHVHGIIVIDKMDDGKKIGKTNQKNVKTRQCLVSINDPNDPTMTIGQKRFQNQGKNTLSSIVGSYKSVVTKNARCLQIDFAWQSRFHDHIIRDSGSFARIQQYIINNPRNWNKDRFSK